MEIGASIKKLQTALLMKNTQVKINTKEYYSEVSNKMMTKYSVTTPIVKKNKKGELKMKDEPIYEGYSKVEVLKCLASLYKKLGDANG